MSKRKNLFFNNTFWRKFHSVVWNFYYIKKKEDALKKCLRNIWIASKLYDIVAGFQDGSEDTSIFVQRIIQAIVISQEKNKKHSEFYVSVLSSAFNNYCQYYQDLPNEDYFEVMKKQPMSIPLAQMTSLGCDAFIKVNSKLLV